MMRDKIRVLHIISGLGQGGAESVLTRLVSHSQEQNIVLSFADEGVYGEVIRQTGVELHCLGMQAGRLTPSDFWRLIKKIRELRPDVVQTWMYHADFIAGLAARLAGLKHIAWGIRNSGYQLKQSSRSAYYFARLSGLMSRLIPQKIIACGEQAAYLHQQWQYDKSRMQVIQNGYDLSRWQEDTAAAKILRQTWGVQADTPVFGFVARWNPLKDHASLLRAFKALKQNYPDARLVLIGKGLEANNTELMSLLQELGLTAVGEAGMSDASYASDVSGEFEARAGLEYSKPQPDVLLLGMRQDVPAIMSALNIHVLSSIAEGFPNVVAEAMACGTPCVVTDVGDAALMVGEFGWVAKPSHPSDLAAKMEQALSFIQGLSMSDKARYQQEMRQFVLEHFSLDTMVQRYEQAWRSMLEQSRK